MATTRKLAVDRSLHGGCAGWPDSADAELIHCVLSLLPCPFPLLLFLLQVITTLNTGKLYYCGVFNPDEDKQNVLMAGCGDKKIYQFDLNTGDVEQVTPTGGVGQQEALLRAAELHHIS